MWDDRYNTDEYVYGKKPNDFLVACAAGLKPGKTLCLAEGEGRNAVYLAGLGFDVTAVDFSRFGLKKAQKLARENCVSLTTIHADLNDYEIAPGAWDVIICFFLHMLPEERVRLHRKVVAGLRPGGVYILEAFSLGQLKYTSGGPKNLEQLLSLRDARRELTGLDFRIGLETERLLDEGDLHSGMCAVTQVMAVKPVSTD